MGIVVGAGVVVVVGVVDVVVGALWPVVDTPPSVGVLVVGVVVVLVGPITVGSCWVWSQQAGVVVLAGGVVEVVGAVRAGLALAALAVLAAAVAALALAPALLAPALP